MRLPAIQQVLQSARATAMRFPVVLAASAVATISSISMVKAKGDDGALQPILVGATLGLPLLFCLTVVGERRVRDALARAGLLAAGAVVLVAFGFAWKSWTEPIQLTRYFQLSAGFHLLVAFLPFAGYPEDNGFWQYNKALFIRFLTAALYSSVLFGGLAIALLALDKLLGIRISGATYARLWLVIAFLFNTWFFLAGVPDNLPALDQRTDYPAGLRVFSQFVLVPIVAIYLAILTIYLGKVIATREWPSGWIGYLVSSVAATGILSWLLIRPLEDRDEYAWVRAYTRGFFIAMMPSIVMVWLAIWKRINQYGVTERRYFLVVLSVWLGAIAVYYAVRRSRSIRVIPASLAAVALLSYAGPWGAYSFSIRSQLRRLEGVLSRNEMLVDGRARPAIRAVSLDDRQEIAGILDYLGRVHGWQSAGPILGDSIPAAIVKRNPSSWDYQSETSLIMARLGMEYSGSGDRTDRNWSSYYVSTREPIAIDDFQFTVPVTNALLGDSVKLVNGAVVWIGGDSTAIRVGRAGQPLLELSLQSLADSAAAFQTRPDSAGRLPNRGRSIPQHILHSSGEYRSVKAELYLTSLMGSRRGPGFKVTSLEGQLLIRF